LQVAVYECGHSTFACAGSSFSTAPFAPPAFDLFIASHSPRGTPLQSLAALGTPKAGDGKTAADTEIVDKTVADALEKRGVCVCVCVCCNVS
jgi:hypothetical protein